MTVPQSSRRARRLAIEGLETRLALAGNDFHDVDEGAAHLAAGRNTAIVTATAERAAPVLRATANRRVAVPRVSHRIAVAPAPVAEGVPVSDRGDFNGDVVVDRGDVAVLAAHLGLAPGATFADGDLTGDGAVALFDLAGMVFSSPALDVAMTSNVTNVDNAGDTVVFTYTVSNTGNSTLTGIMVTDDRGRNPARQTDSVGDNDNLLEFGERWRYTASYTVVQSDLAAGLDLVSVATADSDQTVADTDDVVVHNLSEMPQITIGDVTIIPIDHASFVMTWNGLTIYSDPVGGSSLYTGLPRADLVLVTHNHGDHFSSSTITGVSDNDPNDGDGVARIVAPQAVFNGLTTAQRSMTTVLANGANTSLLGLNVAAVAAYNLDTTHHPQGAGNGYVVTLGDQRIFISGDTDGVAEIRSLEDIDIAFLCMNIPFTMPVSEAISVTRDIDPDYVIPYHYRNQNGTFADLNAFKTGVGRDLGINVRLLDWY